MHEALATGAAALGLLLGFALIALGQERHWERFLGSNWPPALTSRALRAIGLIVIALALPWCIGAQGASFGSLLWVTLVCAAAMSVALLLTWFPQWLRPLASLVARRGSAPQSAPSHAPDRR